MKRKYINCLYMSCISEWWYRSWKKEISLCMQIFPGMLSQCWKPPFGHILQRAEKKNTYTCSSGVGIHKERGLPWPLMKVWLIPYHLTLSWVSFVVPFMQGHFSICVTEVWAAQVCYNFPLSERMFVLLNIPDPPQKFPRCSSMPSPVEQNAI